MDISYLDTFTDENSIHDSEFIAYTLYKLVHVDSMSDIDLQIANRREAREAFLRGDSSQSKFDPSAGGGGGGGGREHRSREKDSYERERENAKEKMALMSNGGRPMPGLSK